jgi:protein-tyrosine phosphatase
MVCLGNICRSPLAEGILQYKINKKNLNWIVDSAGTAGYHVGEAPHHLSQKVAKQNGIDISKQQCRKFVREDIIKFDKIFVMDMDNYNDVEKICGADFNEAKVDLLLNISHPNENKSVPDPWYGKEEGYHQVFKMIDEACEKIIENFS